MTTSAKGELRENILIALGGRVPGAMGSFDVSVCQSAILRSEGDMGQIDGEKERNHGTMFDRQYGYLSR